MYSRVVVARGGRTESLSRERVWSVEGFTNDSSRQGIDQRDKMDKVMEEQKNRRAAGVAGVVHGTVQRTESRRPSLFRGLSPARSSLCSLTLVWCQSSDCALVWEARPNGSRKRKERACTHRRGLRKLSRAGVRQRCCQSQRP